MARPERITRDKLAPLIRARGPVSATELAALLGRNRSTITRTLPEFGDELVTLGATRSTRYLLRRALRNLGNRWPIYRIDERGRAVEWAQLEALHERWWRVRWAATAPAWAGNFMQENGLWAGFPFFLGDLRPQGFLGRLIAGRLSRILQLPDDPRQWSDDDTLVYLESAGDNLPGNLVVGDASLRRALAGSAALPGADAIGDAQRPEAYPVQAVEIARSLPGSSAGGEQPKFLVTLRDGSDQFRAVLVKFSAPMDQQVGRRWADLLICEFHAHGVLADAGLGSPGARLLDAGGRRFLEIPRFDRRGPGGRLGVVSLEALAGGCVGTLARNWADAAAGLRRLELIDSAAVATIHTLQAFGELIGNTDMHPGNLAFFLGESLPLRVTPAYDMLPMLWAPGALGEIIDRRFAPAPPLPAMEPAWRRAAALAETFWQHVSADSRLSPAFARIGSDAADTVRQLRRHVG